MLASDLAGDMTDEASFIISDLTCFPTTVLQLEGLRTVRSQATISYKSLKTFSKRRNRT